MTSSIFKTVMSLKVRRLSLANTMQAMKFGLYTFRPKIYMFSFCLQDASVVVHNPPNTQSVELYFRGEKMAKVTLTLSP